LRFEQVVALGDLQISWVGSDEGEVLVSSEFDIPVSEDADPAEEADIEGSEIEDKVEVEVEGFDEGDEDE
jgi:segregation and condensation protein A